MPTKAGHRVTRHYLPLALLSISGFPDQDGYEVVLVDGNLYPEEEGHARAVEACEGALLYATTGILGYQVADGLHCTQKVKASHPDLPAFIGGWFASVKPELSLETGLYEAVAIGQGELTFRDIVRAVEAGEPLDGVPGLALWRDGEVVRTPPREIAGWDRLLTYPWHLLDFEVYRREQRDEYRRRVAGSLPPPPGFTLDRGYSAAAHCSSYGCPLGCNFCCSPEVCARRWTAMPAERMLDDICELKERWGFDVPAFFDANWGVDERRVRAFAEGLIERRLGIHYYPMMQAESVLHYAPDTLELLAESGLYAAVVGAEAASEETLKAIGKPLRGGGNLEAIAAMERAGISARVTYILGFPQESEASMLATLDECRRMAVACPGSAPTAWPFLPIPGTEAFTQALECGFRAPETLDEWGAFLHFKLGGWWPDALPPRVARLRRLYEHFATLANGTPRGKVGLWERRAHRRLRSDADFERGWPLGKVEAKAFELYDRLEQRLPQWLARRNTEVARGWKTRRGDSPVFHS